MTKAFITGIGGQDGRHLSPYLFQKGYEVAGLIRGQNFDQRELLEHELHYAKLYDGDITDLGSLVKALQDWQPDEVYHLAAVSYVPVSWTAPSHVLEVNVLGTVNILEAVKQIVPNAKIVVASSSEIFGNVPAPQNEQSPMRPASVYGLSKLTDLHLTRQYRDHYGLWASTAISSNHESCLRPPIFVTRKVTRSLARIKSGLQDKIKMGNTQARRDWGYSLDYMVGFHQIIEMTGPDDYVLGTGISHSVQDLLEIAAGILEINLDDVLEGDQKLFRPEDVNESRADPSHAIATFGWNPSTSFEELIKTMCDYDLALCNGGGAMTVDGGDTLMTYPGVPLVRV